MTTSTLVPVKGSPTALESRAKVRTIMNFTVTVWRLLCARQRSDIRDLSQVCKRALILLSPSPIPIPPQAAALTVLQQFTTTEYNITVLGDIWLTADRVQPWDSSTGQSGCCLKPKIAKSILGICKHIPIGYNAESCGLLCDQRILTVAHLHRTLVAEISHLAKHAPCNAA
jgi:hypothetical protein